VLAEEGQIGAEIYFIIMGEALMLHDVTDDAGRQQDAEAILAGQDMIPIENLNVEDHGPDYNNLGDDGKAVSIEALPTRQYHVLKKMGRGHMFGVRKTPFWAIFKYPISLPRQARDKHQETSWEKEAFPQEMAALGHGGGPDGTFHTHSIVAKTMVQLCFLNRERLNELCVKYAQLHLNLEMHAHINRARDAAAERARHMKRFFVSDAAAQKEYKELIALQKKADTLQDPGYTGATKLNVDTVLTYLLRSFVRIQPF